jgi:hypothetical protein
LPSKRRSHPNRECLDNQPGTMTDLQAELEKLQRQIAECEMIRHLATDLRKSELFARLADELKTLAAEMEKALAEGRTYLDRKTQEPSPKEDDQE